MSEDESEPEYTGPIAPMSSFWMQVYWFLVLLALLLIVYFALPALIGHPGHGGPRSQAIQNAKQVGYALFNFENDFGCYPNDEIIKELDDDVFLSSTGGPNYYFSQLIAGGYVDQEALFFAEREGAVEPDNDQSTPDELLKAGEVGFAYVLWDPKMNSGNLPSEAPLAMTYAPPERKRLMKPKSWFDISKRSLIVLRVDMSVADLKSDRKGAVKLKGKDYFDWSQPHWGGQKPKILWPE